MAVPEGLWKASQRLEELYQEKTENIEMMEEAMKEQIRISNENRQTLVGIG